MTNFRQFLENEEKTKAVQHLLGEGLSDRIWRLLSHLAPASAAGTAVSLGQMIGQSAGFDLDQLDQMGIGVEEIAQFLSRSRLTYEQIMLLTDLKEKLRLRLRDDCHKDMSKHIGKDWLKEKSQSVDACEKYCRITKEKEACRKAGYMVHDFGRYKRVARNPFSRRW